MGSTYKVQVGRRGVITFPKALRNQNNIEDGDILNLIEITDGIFIISTVRSQVDEMADKLAREWQESGETLESMLATLREAAGPDTTIIGMNYYNPYLASWLEGDAGQELAVASAQAVALFNGVLASTYDTAGMPLADVALAFQSDDFTTMVPLTQSPDVMVPVNVNNICDFTYMCAPDPRGPDIHANDEGYILIADTFAGVLP